LSVATICVSVNFDVRMEPPGWGNDARKIYLCGVCQAGELT